MGLDFQWNQLPLIGNFAQDPAVDAKRNASHNLALSYHAYRPEAQDARMNALNNQMSMYAPVNAMLGQMYGEGAQFDMSQATQNPLSNRAMNLGAPKGSMMLPEGGDEKPAAGDDKSRGKPGARAQKTPARKTNVANRTGPSRGAPDTFAPGKIEK